MHTRRDRQTLSAASSYRGVRGARLYVHVCAQDEVDVSASQEYVQHLLQDRSGSHLLERVIEARVHMHTHTHTCVHTHTHAHACTFASRRTTLTRAMRTRATLSRSLSQAALCVTAAVYVHVRRVCVH